MNIFNPGPLSLPEEEESDLNNLGVEVSLDTELQNSTDDAEKPVLEDLEHQAQHAQHTFKEQAPDRTLADVVEFPKAVSQYEE